MITLDSCITDYLEGSEQGIHKYKKIFNIAFRGMDLLGLDFFYQIRSFKLPVSATKTVEFPVGCQKYTKIGILNGKGEVIPLQFNSKLTNYASLAPERLQVTQDDALNNASLYDATNSCFYNYYDGGTCSNMYGVPSGAPFVGSFNVDEANNVIILSEGFPYDYLMVECVMAPAEGEEYFIPVQFREALIAYMAWNDIRHMPSTRKGSISDKQDRRSDFYNERRLANARYKPFYVQQAYEMALEMTRMCVKA